MGARERFIDSIEYLRKMGFFKEYSNLTSEEIFEKIREGSISLKYFGLKEVEERWAKKSVFEIDVLVSIYDRKRIWGKDMEMPYIGRGLAKEIFEGIIAISRGVFQPTDVEEEWLERESKINFTLRGMRCFHESKIHFTFRGRRHMIRFRFYEDFLQINDVMREINDLIKDTGHQYYKILDGDQAVFAVVLTEEEADKLIKERGWRLSCEWK